MSTPTAAEPRRLTIGTVCNQLRGEFPDISISKIRYLEDQGLLAPRRTQGGYRLFSDEDVERLRTILRLQRDEFLPLRVIRQELSSPSSAERKRKKPVGLAGSEDELDLGQLCERAGISSELARELEEFGLIMRRGEGSDRRYGEGDAEIALACGKLANFGIAPRHLRAFRGAADRQANMLGALIAPALRSRNAERRQAGLEDLQHIAELAELLAQLLFWRELRLFASS